jgi:two-component system sensor histidine kinase KdpD
MAAPGGDHRVVLNRFSEGLKEHPLELKIPSDLPLVSFDTLLMEQVFANLMENALRHTPPAPLLRSTSSRKKRPLRSKLQIAVPGLPVLEEKISSINSSKVLRRGWVPGSASPFAA